MIMKLSGAGFILLATLGLIFSREVELIEHKKQLEEFGMLLSLLHHEICLLRLPMSLVLEHCSMHLHHPYQKLCTTLRERLDEQRQGAVTDIWRELLLEKRRDFFLDDEEYKLLEESGEVLRMDHVEMKEELFLVYQKRLRRLQELYETSLLQKRRLSRYGTILAGIFLIILFL